MCSQTLFPGLWLTEVTVDSYKVPDLADNGKVTACLFAEKMWESLEILNFGPLMMIIF